jgi:hypothetical protein
MANAKRDDNRVPTLIGTSNADGTTPINIYADPTTHRLLVDLPGGSGTVTSVSVVTANGFSGSVATATTTPAITLSTTTTGILKGFGGALVMATAGSDYTSPSSTETFTNKTFDTAGTGNVFRINATTISTVTGTGAVVLQGSPTITTPSIAKLANLTADGIVTTSGGDGTLSVTTTTGSGSVVLSTSPTLVTPSLGVATAVSINKVSITAPASSAALTLADGSSLVTSGANSITLTSTGATNVTLPTTGTLATLAGSETLSNKVIIEKTSTIADAAGAKIDCSTANIFTLTATTSRTLGTTLNAVSGQKMIINYTASGVASTLTLPTAATGDFAYGSDITALTQTTINKTDVIGCIYNTTVSNKWAVVAYVKGY